MTLILDLLKNTESLFCINGPMSELEDPNDNSLNYTSNIIHFMCTVGLNSKYVSTDGNDASSTSSKVSTVSVPQTPRSEGEILQSSNLKSFTLAELKMATRNFRPDSVLGEGGFGSVYKGWIDEHSQAATKPGTGIVIAVKRLNQDGFQGHKEWLVSQFTSFKTLILTLKPRHC